MELITKRCSAITLQVAIIICLLGSAKAQQRFNTTSLDLGSLNAFEEGPTNWRIVGHLQGGPDDTQPASVKGTGILYNDYSEKVKYKSSANLFTKLTHGDLFVSLDFMIPKGSNAGIYFQGRYEIQLFDSWKKATLHAGDCGGIYERWDDSKPEGLKGFEGHPPRTNASFAPNAWQHLEIEFEAPRFDASGRKTSPARFVKVTLNGTVLHENVVLYGPTRSAAFNDEKPSGPIMIQGDHGPVALRNIQYAMLNDFSVQVKDLRYTYYEGKFPDFAALTPDKVTRTAPAEVIDVRVADTPNTCGLIFSGKIILPEENKYQFTIKRFGLTGLTIDNEEIIKPGDFFGEVTASRTLSKGEHKFQLRYLKNFSWAPSGLSLLVGRANARPYALHAPASLPFIQPEPPIRVSALQHPEVVRSFMWHKEKKMTHVISVGQPGRINYSYNLDQAGILKFWRGDFLNVTDMWYERGEPQTATPLGAAIDLEGRGPLTGTFLTSDSIPMAYTGYSLNDSGTPVFTYRYGEATLEDHIRPSANGDGLTRTVTLKGTTPQPVGYLLAGGKRITKLEKNLFAIDQRYYIRLSDVTKLTPEIKSQNGQQTLVIPQSAAQVVEYTIIW